MRYLALAFTAFAAACATGPSGPSAQQIGKDEFLIPFGQAMFVPGTVFEVRFEALLADSRCPRDVVCVWEGEGRIELGLTMGDGPTVPAELSTHSPVTVRYAGFVITLVALDPYPVSSGPHQPADYVVHVRINTDAARE